MKKLYYVMIVVVVLAMGVGVIFFFRMDSKSSQVNSMVQTWMQENIESVDCLQFEVILETDGNIQTVVNGTQDDDLFPEDNPIYTEETYHVSLLRNESTAKVEHTQTFCKYKDESDDRTEIYSDRIYYIAIADGKVDVYYPENAMYVLRSVDDAAFAEAVSALLFPADVSYLYDDSPIQVIVETEGYAHYTVQGNFDTTYFYAPFAILRGDNPQETANNNVTVSFGLNDQSVLPEDIFRFRMGIVDAELLCPYAYEAWTGNAYANDLQENGYDYRQTITLYFYDGFDSVESFDLPNV